MHLCFPAANPSLVVLLRWQHPFRLTKPVVSLVERVNPNPLVFASLALQECLLLSGRQRALLPHRPTLFERDRWRNTSWPANPELTQTLRPESVDSAPKAAGTCVEKGEDWLHCRQS